MADRVGQQLGHYQLIQLLGRGGFAEVYLGEHLSLRTQAAIKVLYTRLLKEDAEEFLKEARTIAHLIHPGIVRIFDFEVYQDTPFLVMDYAPYGTLRRRYPKGAQLPLPTVVDYVKQVADALQYAHDQKIIHRDIKPENMLIGRRGEVLLSDFGVALIVQQSTRLQNAHEVVGTVSYMAPEQLQGRSRLASDQYSLGIVVYEWLSGSRPFQGTFTEIVSQHMFAPPLSLRQANPSISPDVEQVVMTALVKDPKQRFATIKAFALALEQASRSPHSFAPFAPSSSDTWQTRPTMPVNISPAQYGVFSPENISPATETPIGQQSWQPPVVTLPDMASQPPSPAKLLSGSPVEHASLDTSIKSKRGMSRRALIGGLAVTAGLAVGGGSIAWLVSSQKSASDITRYIYRGHSGIVYIVGWSPDGRRIASGAEDMTVQVWDAATGDNAFTYRDHKGAVYAVAWSHDGTRIVSGGQDNTARLWDAVNGKNILIYTGHTASVNALSWAPDSTRIASASADNTVRVWNALDKSLVFQYSHSNIVRTVAWSSNGRYLASAGDDNTVNVRDVSTGELIYAYHGHSRQIWAIAWSPDSTRIASASADQTVQVWNATDGGNVLTYKGHSRDVTTVDWWSSHIASGSTDKTVQVWDASSGALTYTYTGHTDMVTALRWSPTGSYLASASADKTVRVWQAVE